MQITTQLTMLKEAPNRRGERSVKTSVLNHFTSAKEVMFSSALVS